MAVLIAIYLVIDVFVRFVTDLGESGYAEANLTVELMQRWVFVVPVALIAWAVALWRTGTLGLRWPAFDRGWSFRLPVGTAIVFITWWFATYDYNLFFDQAHWFDRAALVVLAGLTLWRPVFALPWVLLVSTIMNQFDYPIGGYSVAEPFQMVRIVELMIAAMVMRMVIGKWRLADFFVVMISLLAGGYFLPGLGKLRLGWVSMGAHVELNLFGGYAKGWLGNLSFETIGTILRFLRHFAWPMLIATAVVEFGAALILWTRRTLLGWLMLFIAFHLGVLALTGIFFWRWIAVEVALLLFLSRDRLVQTLPVFNWQYALLASGLIVVAPIWARPANLAWLDSPVTYSYEFVATDADGVSAELSPQFFRPYDFQFSLDGFNYLSGDGNIFSGDREVLDLIFEAGSAEQILALEQEFGEFLFDEERAEDFDRFIKTRIATWNERGSPTGLWPIIRGPSEILTIDPNAYDGDGPIESVTVVRILAYWDGDEYQEISTTTIREIDIGSGA